MNEYPAETPVERGLAECVVAFINKNSGERSAAVFVRAQLEENLGEARVFDLFPSPGKPPAIDEAVAFLAKHKPDLLIVAGGDGTVALGMDIAETARRKGQIGARDAPVAVLPMGTGNDLSRSLGFGGGYTKPASNAKKRFRALLDKTMRAEPVMVDRFHVDTYLAPALSSSSSSSDDDDDEEEEHDDARRGGHAGRTRSPDESSSSDDDERIAREETEDDAKRAQREGAENESADGKEKESPEANPEKPDEAPAATLARDALPEDSPPPENHAPVGSSQRASSNPIVSPQGTGGREKVFSKAFMNYVSIGFDAEVTSQFGRFRDGHPQACSSRCLNKLWYGCFGCRAMCCSSNFPKHRVSVRVDGERVKVPSDCKAIVLCNMITYAGGMVLWQDKKQRFPPASVSDKKLEVTSLEGVLHFAGVGTHTRSAKKLGQGSTVRVRVPADYFMQYDGEPVDELGSSAQDAISYVRHIGQMLATTLPLHAKAHGANDDDREADYDDQEENDDDGNQDDQEDDEQDESKAADSPPEDRVLPAGATTDEQNAAHEREDGEREDSAEDDDQLYENLKE